MQCICGRPTVRRVTVEEDYCERCQLTLPATPRGLKAREIVQEHIKRGADQYTAVLAGIEYFYKGF